jgi:TonB family protein
MWKLPPKSDGLKVVLRYNLARNGSVSFVRVEKSSGNQSFDGSAILAVKRASPFPPPPKSFPVGDLRMVLEPTLSKRIQFNLLNLRIYLPCTAATQASYTAGSRHVLPSSSNHKSSLIPIFASRLFNPVRSSVM